MSDLLRFITCGSAGGGKSALVRRLLSDSHPLDPPRAESVALGGIDVDEWLFATARRRFSVADTPGGERSTAAMAMNACSAHAAIIVVDAETGLTPEARRHGLVLDATGARCAALVVNKMDVAGFRHEAFERIAGEFRDFARGLAFTRIDAIAACALEGDNVAHRSGRMPWYLGPTLLDWLEGMPVEAQPGQAAAFRMPVQLFHRPGPELAGFAGRIAAGRVRVGDAVRIVPSGAATVVKAILRGAHAPTAAQAGEFVTLSLMDDVDVKPGDVIAAAADPPPAADQFEARVLWMDEHPMVAGRSYGLHIHSMQAGVQVTAIKYRVDTITGAHLAARRVAMNQVAVVNLSTSQPVAFEPYASSRALGAFVLVDEAVPRTVAAGAIDFALRRAANLQWQSLDVNKAARARSMRQKPFCIWLTGLPGSGKSTLANLLDKRLHAGGRHTYVLDGDNVRHGLNRDLGFTEADRVENIRRVAEVAKLMVDAGLIVIVSFISPFRAERRVARALFETGEFIEVFVDTPLEECERRDPKGLYAKARRGELANFTGIDSPYEAPESPEVRVSTAGTTPEASVREILEWLER